MVQNQFIWYVKIPLKCKQTDLQINVSTARDCKMKMTPVVITAGSLPFYLLLLCIGVTCNWRGSISTVYNKSQMCGVYLKIFIPYIFSCPFFFFFSLCTVLESWSESQFLSYYLLSCCQAILCFHIKNENWSLEGFLELTVYYPLQKVYHKLFIENMECL